VSDTFMSDVCVSYVYVRCMRQLVCHVSVSDMFMSGVCVRYADVRCL
jgi:hypothetical protein